MHSLMYPDFLCLLSQPPVEILRNSCGRTAQLDDLESHINAVTVPFRPSKSTDNIAGGVIFQIS